jgi:hypothetical protein
MLPLVLQELEILRAFGRSRIDFIGILKGVRRPFGLNRRDDRNLISAIAQGEERRRCASLLARVLEQAATIRF